MAVAIFAAMVASCFFSDAVRLSKAFVDLRVAYVAAATMDFAAALRVKPSASAMPAWGLRIVQSAPARIFGPRCAAAHR